MAKWLLTVETNCSDPAREAEFNEWYNNIHLPDVLEVPGFVRAIRYENTDTSEGKAKFLAIYEVETDDLDKVMKTLEDTIDRKRAEGRMNDLGVLVSQGIYRQIGYLSN